MRSKRVKTKIFAVSGILCFVALVAGTSPALVAGTSPALVAGTSPALVAGTSPALVSRAEGDPILSEIARYKTWDRVSTAPIAVPLQQSEADNNGVFIVGNELTTWSVTDLGGG